MVDELRKKKWLKTLSEQEALGRDVNPNLYKEPFFPAIQSAIPYDTKMSKDLEENIVTPAAKKEYGTPEKFREESDKFLEKELDNPSDRGVIGLPRSWGGMRQIASEPEIDSNDSTGRITDIEAANSISPREKRGIANAQGDMLVGASHALLGLLSGNHNRAAMEYGKANQYVSGQRKQDIADLSKLVKTVGPDGKPIYTPTVEAADMLAYEAPKGGSGGAAGSFQYIQYYDPNEKRYKSIKFNTRTGNEEIIDRVVRPSPEKLYKTEDVQGTETQKRWSQYEKNPSVVDTTPGLGSKYGVGTKGRAEQIEKGYGKAQEEYQNLSGALVDARSARQSLDKTQDPRVLAESVYSMVRAVESKGVLTDQDFENITGMRYMSWYRNMDNMLKTKAYGDIEELRNSFKGLADKIQNKIQTRMKSIPERFAPDTREGQKGLEEVVPKMKIDKKAQAELIKAERIASKKYGKGTEKYNKFMEFAKDSLGQ